jgi:hypothetical protein
VARLLREMGHLAGRPDDPSEQGPDPMVEVLPTGVRRLAALDTIFSGLG